MAQDKQKLAIVLGTIPAVDDVDQFRLLADRYDIQVVASQSIVGYLSEMSYFQDLTCLALPDYDENPSYLPGLEKVLGQFDVVVVKGRIGIYAYQCVKAKWKHRFRMIVWVDNLTVAPGEDIQDMRVIRSEVTNSADGFIVQTKSAADVLAIEGVGNDRIMESLPWVEARTKRTKKSRAEARSHLGAAESDFLIACIGQIEWEEGLDDLVSGIKLAILKKPSLKDRVKVIFCGIGTYSSALRDSFVRHDMDYVPIYVKPSRASLEFIYQAVDIQYINSIPSRDRIDGDPYRALTSMVNEIPLLASRSPVIEEFCGKHRVDFCMGSIKSLSEAIIKSESKSALLKDIVRKNRLTATERFDEKKVQENMNQGFDKLTGLDRSTDESSVDHLVLEVEARITNKQYLDAIEIIEGIFRRNDVPTHHRANLYRLIGDCFAKLGDNNSAKDAYIQAAELDPYSPKVYIGLGTISLVKNNFDIAVLHFQKAVGLAPTDEMANLGLGLAFHGMDERREAKRWVIKALGINFENTAAIFTLVKISHELNEYQDCEKVMRKYLESHPNDYNMIYSLAGIFFKQGRYQETLEMTEAITSVDPLDQKAHALAKQAKRALEDDAASGGSRG